MKTVLKIVLSLFLALIFGAFLLPEKAVVERQIEINRPANFIFQFVNGFSRFNEWSPWFEKDPKATYQYSGPATGVGAVMSWESKLLGGGSQKVTESVENSSVGTELSFDGGGGSAQYVLESQGDRTIVRWIFETHAGNNPIKRWMNLAMDRFVGPDYSKGLENLKARVEKLPNARFGNFDVKVQSVGARHIFRTDVVVRNDLLELVAALSKAYGMLGTALEAQKIDIAPAAPLGFDLGEKDGKYYFQAGLTTTTPAANSEGFVAETLPEGRVLYAVHTGGYDKLQNLANLLRAYADVWGYRFREPVVFAFVDDPSLNADVARTEIMLYLEPKQLPSLTP